MNKTMRAVAALGATATMAFSSAGMAQGMEDRGFYIGASIGQSKVKDFCSGVGAGGVTCEETDTAFKILAGYQVSKHFALELGYSQLGEAAVRNFLGMFAKVEATAWEAVAVGMLPLADQVSLYGKVGMYRADSEFSTNVVVPGVPQSFSESNNDLTFGVGLQFDFNRNFGLRAEWQRYQDLGGPQIGESDLDLISIGVVYRFR